MSAGEAHQSDSAQRPSSLQLVCREVWGGNRPIDVPVELPGLRGQLFSRPCDGGRGGDIHYLSVCNSGLVARLCLADVVGHGEAVAQVSTTIHGLLRKYIDSLDQRRVLRRLNERLSQIGFSALTTAAAITYFPPWRRLSLSYAGHPPAWFCPARENHWAQVEPQAERRLRKAEVNLPLAADEQTTFTRETFRVRTGDRLLVLTDGVLEAPDATGSLFGHERLGEVLNDTRAEDPADIAKGVIDAIVTHAGPSGLAHDDVTLLVVEFCPGPAGPMMWHIIKNRLLRPRGNSDHPAFAKT